MQRIFINAIRTIWIYKNQEMNYSFWNKNPVFTEIESKNIPLGKKILKNPKLVIYSKKQIAIYSLLCE